MLQNGIKEYPYLHHDKIFQKALGTYKDYSKCKNLEKSVISQPVSSFSSKIFSQKEFGVNLIGYSQGQLGIGEDLRSTADALKKVGIPYVIINFPPGKEIPQNDHTLDSEIVNEGNYAFNIFCLTVEEIARFLMERGSKQFDQTFNIGYCPWELKNWPGPWLPLFGLCDEFWASSEHTLSSLKQGLRSPNKFTIDPEPSLSLMPLAISLPKNLTSEKASILDQNGLPEGKIIFTFSFDLNSSIARTISNGTGLNLPSSKSSSR